MVGLVGRSTFLLGCRLGQCSRRCSVVSLFYVKLALFVLGGFAMGVFLPRHPLG